MFPGTVMLGGPGQAFGKGFLDNHRVQHQVAVTTQSLGEGDQQATERGVTAPRQAACHACLGRPRVEQDQAGHGSSNQDRQRRRVQGSQTHTVEGVADAQVPQARGSIQTRRHEEHLRPVCCDVAVTVYQTLVSQCVFSCQIGQARRVSPMV
jgi:hypothetical protein